MGEMKMARDLTDKQFYAALERNGFKKPVLFWVTHRDLPNHSFPMVVYSDGRIAKRETISRLIKRRDAELANAAAKKKSREPFPA